MFDYQRVSQRKSGYPSSGKTMQLWDALGWVRWFRTFFHLMIVMELLQRWNLQWHIAWDVCCVCCLLEFQFLRHWLIKVSTTVARCWKYLSVACSLLSIHLLTLFSCPLRKTQINPIYLQTKKWQSHMEHRSEVKLKAAHSLNGMPKETKQV